MNQYVVKVRETIIIEHHITLIAEDENAAEDLAVEAVDNPRHDDVLDYDKREWGREGDLDVSYPMDNGEWCEECQCAGGHGSDCPNSLDTADADGTSGQDRDSYSDTQDRKSYS
jgi:hypothetical protein